MAMPLAMTQCPCCKGKMMKAKRERRAGFYCRHCEAFYTEPQPTQMPGVKCAKHHPNSPRNRKE